MDVLVVLLALVVALLLGLGLLVAGVARGRRRANEVVPGVTSTAPLSWAGAHTVEARLHRRLRDAVRGLRAQRGSATTDELSASLEQAALELDAHLVAVAALPERVRGPSLTRVEAAVAAFEDTAAVLALRGGSFGAGAAPGGATQIEEIAERLRLLEAARAELDAAVPDASAPPRTDAGTMPPPPRERRKSGDAGGAP